MQYTDEQLDLLEAEASNGNLEAVKTLYNYYKEINDEEQLTFWSSYLFDDQENVQQTYDQLSADSRYEWTVEKESAQEEANKKESDIVQQYFAYRNGDYVLKTLDELNALKNEGDVFASVSAYEIYHSTNEELKLIPSYENAIHAVERLNIENKNTIICELQEKLANASYAIYQETNNNKYKEEASKCYQNVLELIDESNSNYSAYKERVVELSQQTDCTKWYEAYLNGTYKNLPLVEINKLREEGNIFAELAYSETYNEQDKWSAYDDVVQKVLASKDKNRLNIALEMLNVATNDQLRPYYMEDTNIYNNVSRYNEYKTTAIRLYRKILDVIEETYKNEDIGKEEYHDQQVKYLDKILEVYELGNNVTDGEQRNYFEQYAKLANDEARMACYYGSRDDRSSETIELLQKITSEPEQWSPRFLAWVNFILAYWNLPNGKGKMLNVDDCVRKVSGIATIYDIARWFNHKADKKTVAENRYSRFYWQLTNREYAPEQTFWSKVKLEVQNNAMSFSTLKEMYNALELVICRYSVGFYYYANGVLKKFTMPSTYFQNEELSNNYKNNILKPVLDSKINISFDTSSLPFPNFEQFFLLAFRNVQLSMINSSRTNSYGANEALNTLYWISERFKQQGIFYKDVSYMLTERVKDVLDPYIEIHLASALNTEAKKEDRKNHAEVAENVLNIISRDTRYRADSNYMLYMKGLASIGKEYNNNNLSNVEVGKKIAELINSMPVGWYYPNDVLITMATSFVTYGQFKRTFKNRYKDVSRLSSTFAEYYRKVEKENSAKFKAFIAMLVLMIFIVFKVTSCNKEKAEKAREEAEAAEIQREKEEEEAKKQAKADALQARYDDVKEYLANRYTHADNEYTGLLASSSSRVLFIQANGLLDFAIDADLTPTLYTLKTNGLFIDGMKTPHYTLKAYDKTAFMAFTSLVPVTEDDMSYIKYNSLYRAWSLTPQSLSNLFATDSNDYDNKISTKTTDGYRVNSDKSFVDSFSYLITQGKYEYWITSKEKMINSDEYKAQIYAKYPNLSEEYVQYLENVMDLDRAVGSLINKFNKYGINVNIVLFGDGAQVHDDESAYDTFFTETGTSKYDGFNNTDLIMWSNTGKIPTATYKKSCTLLDLYPTIANLYGKEYDVAKTLGQDIFDPNYVGLTFNADLSEKSTNDYDDIFEYMKQIVDLDYFNTKQNH